MACGEGNRNQVSYLGLFELSDRDSLGLFIDPLAATRVSQPFRTRQPGLRIGGVPLWKHRHACFAAMVYMFFERDNQALSESVYGKDAHQLLRVDSDRHGANVADELYRVFANSKPDDRHEGR